MHPRLNLPSYSFKIKELNQRTQIFDSIRKKYVALTPEEWVRQNFIQYLIHEKEFPTSLIAIEIGSKYNLLKQRSDVVIYSKTGDPLLLIECKAPEVNITEEVFYQIARYNKAFRVKYLIVTNGMVHYFSMIDKNDFRFLDDIPSYRYL